MNNESPKKAARRLSEHKIKKGFEPEGLYEYQSITGEILYWRLRLKHPETGEKYIRPMSLDAEKCYVLKEPDFVDGKPLYSLPLIHNSQNETVWVVEGEKCSDKLIKLGLIATTSGSADSASTANWKILQCRNIIIWPDNDSAGVRYAEEVAGILAELKCNIKIVDVEKLNLSNKQDCVDWLASNPGASKDNLFALPFIEPVNKADDNLDNSDEILLENLSLLSEFDYARQRTEAANKLGVSLRVLDKVVKQKHLEHEEGKNNICAPVIPWDEEVILNELLDELSCALNRFIVFPSVHHPHAIALWIIHTYLIDELSISPLLHITSPEKRCGKSTLLDILQIVVNRPLIAANISPAALFRSVEKWKPTLILDEADTFANNNEELRGLLNAGHRRDLAYIIRCVGDKHEPKQFSTWCPKVIAGIGKLADTIEDRSVIIELRRKLSDEKKDPLTDEAKAKLHEIARKCVRFIQDNTQRVPVGSFEGLNALNDRAADNWRPLLAIAELADDKWRRNALAAALELSGKKEEAVSLKVELLADIKNILEETGLDRISTAELLAKLCADSEAPWVTYNRGKPLSARQLANKLKEFSIISTTLRLPGSDIKKGYYSASFDDAFTRYLPSGTRQTEGLSVTPLQPSIHAGLRAEAQALQSSMLLIEEPLEASFHKGCNAVTDKTPSGEGLEGTKRVRVEL